MSQRKQKIYMNEAQLLTWLIAARNEYIIASRRFGKTEGIIAPRLLRNIQAMPRGTHLIVGRTYKQLLVNTLPGTFAAINRLGYQEDVHYFIGRKAPQSCNFKLPLIKPKSWENLVHWYNGSINILLSQDIKFSSNSLTASSLIGDEAKTINYDKLQNETFPTLTPLPAFKDCPWENGRTFCTDMPTTKSGSWILSKEKDMDKELIELMKGILHEIQRMKIKCKTIEYVNAKVRDLTNELNLLRKEATLFAVFNILDNLEIVGERYIADQHRDLTPLVFQTAILSKRIGGVEGGFYGALDPKLHYYDRNNNSYLHTFRKKNGTIDLSAIQAHNDCRSDGDIDHNMPLCISSDTNINVNWIVVGQPNYDQNVLRTLKSFWVKGGQSLNDVCNKFADYYAPLLNRDVVFYYDATFLQGKSSIMPESFYEVIVRVLSERGFNVTPVYIYSPMRHDEKHLMIQQALKGENGLFPMFNEINNQDLLHGMEETGTRVNPHGWGKDKSAEKDPDSIENPIEWRTDGGDTWDTLFIGASIFPVHSISTFNGSVVYRG